jgi:DNA-binding NtrC family response regulator
MSILVVDDETVALKSVQRLLHWEGYKDVMICDNGHEATQLIKDHDFDVVLLDIMMPELDGLEVLQETKPFKPFTEFIMLTAVSDLDTAVNAVRMGAYDYLTKPVNNERLLLTIKRAYERKGLLSGLTLTEKEGGEPKPSSAFAAIITQNNALKEQLRFAEVMARSGVPVLITGDSGTGKELLAKGIHQAGPTPDGPFVAVNVAAIPESMFESQFFGHRKGAFTGAFSDHKGFFEQANHGTLFLDEIGELPLHQQVKFLRILEEKSFVPLGGQTHVDLNVRIVSATSKNLDEACKDQSFRMDLLYRLKAAHVHLPPLQDRADDVPALAEFFIKKAASSHQRPVHGFSPEALHILRHRAYPGNIRELSQLIESAVLICKTEIIAATDLGKKSLQIPSSIRTLCTFKDDYERHLAFVLEHTGGNRTKAAAILGVSLRQIHRKLAELERKTSQ